MTYNKADAMCLYWHPVPIQINPALRDLENFVIFITFDPWLREKRKFPFNNCLKTLCDKIFQKGLLYNSVTLHRLYPGWNLCCRVFHPLKEYHKVNALIVSIRKEIVNLGLRTKLYVQPFTLFVVTITVAVVNSALHSSKIEFSYRTMPAI